MLKIFSSSISTPNKNISAISFFRNFRFFSLVFFSLLVVISCGDTTASGEEEGTVTSVTIDGTTSSYTITVGETTLNLTATVLVTGGAAETVKWVSSDPDIATVSATGEVTGVKAGEVRITAVSTVDETKTDTVKVTVRVPVGTVNSVTIDGTAPYTITAGGTTLDLTATVLVTGGAAETVKWVSSDPDIATVSATGEVTGVKAGEVRITAVSTVDETKTDTVKVTVRDRVGTIDSVVVKDQIAIPQTLEAGSTFDLDATVVVSGGAVDTVKWTTSDEAIATVDTNGKVTGVTPGNVTITVTSTEDRTKADSVALKITAKPLTGFTYTNPTQNAVPAGTDITPLVATITPAGATVTYSVTKGTLPTGLTLANDGGISGAINAEGVYNFTVTATGTGAYLGETQTADVSITIVNGPPIFFDDTGDITAATVDITAATVPPLVAYIPRVRDPDGDGVTLSLENNIGNNFQIVRINNIIFAKYLTSGTYTVDIRARDTDATDPKSSVITLTLNVIETVTSVTINPASPTVELGKTTTLTATVVVANGPSSGVTWSSDDTTVATINPTTGVVTGEALGTAMITATSTEDASKTHTVTVTVKPVTVATAIMDTAYSNVNNVQRNYYFLVNVMADKEDKLKLVVKESSEPAPTAAEIKAGAGQTKTLSPTAKTVLFAYPIGSTIGNYKGAALGHYIHTASSNIDGLFLKPGTAYTVYATAPDDTGAVLTGGSYTPPAFDATKPMMDLSSTVNGVSIGAYDESLFASTLSAHADDPLFVLPMVLARGVSDTELLALEINSDILQANVGFNDAGYDSFGRGRFFFPSLYYDSARTVPHRFDAGTGTSAQKASFSFLFLDSSTTYASWSLVITYNQSPFETLPNKLTVTKED